MRWLDALNPLDTRWAKITIRAAIKVAWVKWEIDETHSILLFVLSVLVIPLYAHHGRGATYDMKKRVT
jgi:hypothetical protein